MVGRGKKGAWCSRTKDQNQYLQVDFWRNVKITKVATQSGQDNSQWVTHYKLSYAVDSSTLFQTYQEMGVDKVRGNVLGDSQERPNNIKLEILADTVYVRVSWSQALL